jgi:hypothetical protein
VNGPATTETADVIVIDGSFNEDRLSQLCCPHTVLVMKSVEIVRTTRIGVMRMSISSTGQ